MLTKRTIVILFSVVLVVMLVTSTASARPLADTIGTGFTYQGRLMDGGNPANGSYDFQFNLYNALSGGGQVGGTLTQTGVTVANGLFTVQLDFGNVFDGTALYLQVAVRSAGGGSYTPQTPLQPLSATPYALYSEKAGNAALLEGNQLGNAFGDVPLNNGSLNINLNADQLDGHDASNLSGRVPISNGTVNTNLNADLLDGHDAGNLSGNVPLSNGTINVNLNAQFVDGEYVDNGAGNIPLNNGTLNTNLNADMVDSKHAGNAISNVPLNNTILNVQLNADYVDGHDAGNASGNVALNNGTLNTSLNADLLDGHDAGNASGNVPLSNGTLNTNLNADLLDGLHASAFAPSAKNLIIVAKSGGNYTSITAALNSITDASDTNHYLIFVAPGVYNEQVTMLPYVDIEGAGELATKITRDGQEYCQDGTVVGASNAELRFLTVESTGSGISQCASDIFNTTNVSLLLTHINLIASGEDTNESVTNYGSLTMSDVSVTVNGPTNSLNIGIENATGGSLTMTNVSVSVTSSNLGVNYGIKNENSTLTMKNVTITASGGGYTYGVYIYGSSPVMTGVTASATGGTYNYAVENISSSSPVLTGVTASASGGTNSYGMWNDSSAPTIQNSVITGSGGSSATDGIHDVAASGTYVIKISNSQISGGNSTIYNSIAGFTVQVGSSQLIGGGAQGSGTYLCVFSYNASFVALSSTCH